MNQEQTNDLLIQKIIKDQKLRRKLAQESHQWFFHLYFSHYIKYGTADFQKEIFQLSEDESVKSLAIVAFRGSAKSTIMSMSYPIWSIFGKQNKKHILILSKTQQQSQQILKNLKTELESNELLRADLGPLEEQQDQWNTSSLVIPKYNARITAASTEQKVRGLRHNQYRPQIIICDDIEDLASVKTLESRDKTHQWLRSEVIPAGDIDSRQIIIGNLLHEDSLMMRIKRDMESGELDGVFKEYPLIDMNGFCLWPGKFPTEESIENERRRIGNESSFQREYLLNMVSDCDRVIYPEWIKYYDATPNSDDKSTYRGAFIGIDLAISQKTHADYTAMVSCVVYGDGKDFKIYILPNPINEKLTIMKTLETAKFLSDTIGKDKKAKIYVEEVGYQGAVTQYLDHDGYPAEGISVSQDKRSRLSLVSHMVEDGTVVFPRVGAEKLINQLTNFQMERYDDLADAFSLLLQQVSKLRRNRPVLKPFFIENERPRNDWSFGNVWNTRF